MWKCKLNKPFLPATCFLVLMFCAGIETLTKIDPLELEMGIVVSYHVGAGNLIQVLYRSTDERKKVDTSS